jgi:acetyl-CoA/propionyl-CoA carboxylase biotin carboxyl carrier protein
LTNALDETVVLGLTTNLRFLRWLVRQPTVVSGAARIDSLDRIWPPPEAAAATIRDAAWSEAARLLDAGGWRLNAPPTARLVADDGEERSVAVAGAPADPLVDAIRVGDAVHVDIDGRSVAFRIAAPPDVDRAARAAASAHTTGTAEIVAPMPGSVLAVHVAAGQTVASGDPLVTLEAMKMEHVVAAPAAGRVVGIAVTVGKQVARGQGLATLES